MPMGAGTIHAATTPLLSICTTLQGEPVKPHLFSRESVATARQKVRDGNFLYRIPEPADPVSLSRHEPNAFPPTYQPHRAWMVHAVLAQDHEELETLANKAIAALQLLDDLTDRCPVCGSQPLDFGAEMNTIVRDGLGVEIRFKHTKSCPILEVWMALVYRIQGEVETYKLNKVAIRSTD